MIIAICHKMEKKQKQKMKDSDFHSSFFSENDCTQSLRQEKVETQIFIFNCPMMNCVLMSSL